MIIFKGTLKHKHVSNFVEFGGWLRYIKGTQNELGGPKDQFSFAYSSLSIHASKYTSLNIVELLAPKGNKLGPEYKSVLQVVDLILNYIHVSLWFPKCYHTL